jgi:4-amino-4-deoxy-L-arabinose transferase-like glycosyltransferase
MFRGSAIRIILALVALSVLITPWRRELFVGDETKYAQVVREMRVGAFFLPTLEGTPFTHKPPLHFWMIDLLTYLFGVYSLWSFVLPSLAGFIVLLWLMWWMEGPLAAFVCGTSLMVWGSAQTARMDIAFTVTIVIAAWMLLLERPVVAGIALGFGTLIKGPMAPVIVIFLFAFEWLRKKPSPAGRGRREAAGEGRAPHPALRSAQGHLLPLGEGILLMIIIPMFWFVPAMLIGGNSYTREVLIKQTAGRAVGAWVHRSPVWFYIAHAPATLFPWFLILIVAIIAAYRRNDDRGKFYVSWILAVLVPYSVMSSKLDVYMMAMIPPAALLIARLVASDDHWAWRANMLMLVVLLTVGTIAPFVSMPYAKELKPLFVTLAVASLIAIIISLRTRTAVVSTICVGFVPLCALFYAALFLMPLVNELASDRPIVRALIAQRVAPEEIALFTVPHLWTRDMPRSLERVRYVSPQLLRARPATVIVTSRAHANEIGDVLQGYRRVDEFRLLGKPFDVYRH